MKIAIEKKPTGKKIKITLTTAMDKKPLIVEWTAEQVKSLVSMLNVAADAESFEISLSM